MALGVMSTMSINIIDLGKSGYGLTLTWDNMGKEN